jgi:hypothetical protein
VATTETFIEQIIPDDGGGANSQITTKFSLTFEPTHDKVLLQEAVSVVVVDPAPV